MDYAELEGGVAPRMAVYINEAHRYEVEVVLRTEVLNEGLDWYDVEVVGIMGASGCSVPAVALVRARNQVTREQSDVGGIYYYPDGYQGGKFKFGPYGNIYSVFDYIRGDYGYSYRKYNPWWLARD